MSLFKDRYSASLSAVLAEKSVARRVPFVGGRVLKGKLARSWSCAGIRFARGWASSELLSLASLASSLSSSASSLSSSAS